MSNFTRPDVNSKIADVPILSYDDLTKSYMETLEDKVCIKIPTETVVTCDTEEEAVEVYNQLFARSLAAQESHQ